MSDESGRVSSSSINPSVWISLGAAICGVILVFGLLPYTSSYDQQIRSLFYTLWLATRSFEGQWEHCLLVPVLCGVLIYLKRENLVKLEVKPHISGAVMIFAAAFIFWIGARTEVMYFGYISLQVFLAGMIMWLFGLKWMKALIFPWLFFGFTYPLVFLDTMLAFPLRMIMTDISYHFLNLIGMDVVMRGTGLLSAAVPDLGIAAGEKFSVDIANPCSGIRSLFALMMVSALFGYFSLKPTSVPWAQKVERVPYVGEWLLLALENWKRWILFGLSLPLAVAGNFFRILMLIFGTKWFGSEFAIGSMEEPSTYHMVAGFFVFIVALGGMLGVTWLLERKLKPES